jgi:ribosomal protein L14
MAVFLLWFFVLVFNIVLFVIVGSAITGPLGKECSELWPRIASAANAIV